MPAPLPENEERRLAKLHSYEILDTPPEADYDVITKLIARSLGVPFVSISFIDKERQWMKSSIGFTESEIYRSLSFCAHSILSDEPLLVKNTIEDERFAQNPLVTAQPLIRAYAGFPIISEDGYAVGVLAIADKRPRTLFPEELPFLKDLATLIAHKLDSNLKAREINQHANHFEKNREKLELSSLILEKLVKLSPEVVYLYNYADKAMKFSNKQEQLPFPNQGGQLSSAQAVDVLERFDKFKDQNLIEFSYKVAIDNNKYKEFTVQECVVTRDAHSQPIEILGIATNKSSDSEKQLRIEQLTQELAKSSEMFSAVLNCTSEGIIVSNEKGAYLYFNSTAEKILGIGMSMANSTLWSNSYGYFYPDKKTPFPADERPLAKAIKGINTDQVEIFIRNSVLPQGAMVVMNGRPLYNAEKKIKGGVVTFNNVTQIKSAQDQLANLSHTDELTKLPNARALLGQLTQRLGTTNFALGIVDIDQFQKINNLHGHQAGDRVIQSLGKTLKWRMRKQDFLGRLKSDEFYVIFSDVDDAAAHRLAEGLKKGIAEAKEAVPFTVSIGLKIFSESFKDNLELYIKAVDDALYKAKTTGKGTVYVAK